MSSSGGRVIISSDGVWDALSAEVAIDCCRGMPPDSAAEQIVKVSLKLKVLVSINYVCLYLGMNLDSL